MAHDRADNLAAYAQLDTQARASTKVQAREAEARGGHGDENVAVELPSSSKTGTERTDADSDAERESQRLVNSSSTTVSNWKDGTTPPDGDRLCEPACERTRENDDAHCPASELVPAGQDEADTAIRDALAELRSRPQRDEQGRFIKGSTETLKTGTTSEQFWALVESTRRDLVGQIARDLGLDEPTKMQEAMIENCAEVILLRKSLWFSLIDRDGPITAKGNSRRMLDAYFRASDRECNRLTALGLARGSKVINVAEAFAAVHEQREAQQ